MIPLAILTNQSFSEAGGLEAFPDLEMAGMVMERIQRKAYESVGDTKKSLDACLETTAAQNIGCTHVFEIKYNIKGVGAYSTIKGVGYRSKK